MKSLLTITALIGLSTVAVAEGIPCWIRCRRPPKVQSGKDVPEILRLQANPPLKLLAKTSGLLTTYAGKFLGIQGWRDYHLSAVVVGTVVHAAGSTDGFYTIDLQMEEMSVNTEPVDLRRDSFIRIEVLPFVRKGAPLPVRRLQKIRAEGDLMWDADGFLEIHPKHSHDIRRLNGS
jgi:hypothetical protein